MYITCNNTVHMLDVITCIQYFWNRFTYHSTVFHVITQLCDRKPCMAFSIFGIDIDASNPLPPACALD